MKKIFLLFILVLTACCSQAYAKAAPIVLPQKLLFQVKGIRGDALDNVLAQLKAQQEGAPVDPPTKMILQWYSDAPSLILQALKPYGYFQAKINPSIQQEGNVWTAVYTIDPGEPVKIDSVSVSVSGEGQSQAFFQKLVKAYPIHPGDLLNTPLYQNTKKDFFDLAQDQGYLEAKFTMNKIIIDLHHHHAKLILAFDTGPRFYFGEVTFSKTPFQKAFLNRYLPFEPGEPYSNKKILQLQSNLSSSRYFSVVSIDPKIKKAQHYHVPIEVNLVTRKRDQFLLGGGYGTDTGPRVSLGWTRHYINSLGHYFVTQMRLSSVQNLAEARYVIPGNNPLTEQYNITASLMQTDISQGDSTTQQLGGNYSKTLNDWQQTLGLSYQREIFKFNGEDQQYSHYLIPNASWMKIIGNKPLNPTDGYRFSLVMQGASKEVLSNTNFLKTQISAKSIYPVTDNLRTVIRGSLGTTYGEEFDKLPLTMRFYTGGSQSVRGYGFDDLGPGRFLREASAEVQQRIKGDFFAAVFYDTGMASDSMGTPMKHGAGVGIVWDSPVGQIQLDLTRALSDHGHPMRVQFSMGPAL